MPTIKFLDAGTAETQDFSNWASTSGTPTSVSTALAATDVRSINIPANSFVQSAGSVTADAGSRVSFYMKFDTRAAAKTVLACGRFNVKLDASNFLILEANSVTLVTGSVTINAASIHRISLAWTITSISVYTIKLWLDGVLELSVVNGSNLVGSAATSIRFSETSTTMASHVSNVYVDDGTTLDDVGDVRVTAKLPNALNTNNFDTQIGSSVNRYDDVNQRPLSEAKGWSQVGTSDVQENYGVQNAATGDADLTGATILGYRAWVWAKRGEPTTRLIQSFKNKNNSGAGTTLAVTVSGAAVGNTFLVAFVMDGATGTVSCADNATGTTNTYTVDVDKAAASPGTGNVRTCIIRAYINSITSLTTVTITHPSVTARAAVVSEFGGINQTTPLDKTASAVGTTGNASSGATATTTQNDEVIFGAIGAEDNATFSNTTSSSPAATFINSDATTGGGATSNVAIQAQYALQTATGTATSAATPGANTDWAACCATYKVAAGSITTGTPKIMVNGSEAAIVLTTSSQLFNSYTTTGTYPTNVAGIGMRSTAATPDTYFYEGGIAVAFIPGAGGVTVPLLEMHYRRMRSA